MQAPSGASFLTYEDDNDDRNDEDSDHEQGSNRGFDEEGDENADRAENEQEVADAPAITEYEALRLKNIARNAQVFVNLGLTKPEAPPKVSFVLYEH